MILLGGFCPSETLPAGTMAYWSFVILFVIVALYVHIVFLINNHNFNFFFGEKDVQVKYKIVTNI